MNLNDPFGRMAARQQRDYASLRTSLEKAGVTRREQVQELRDGLGKRAWLIGTFVVVLALVLALLFPEAQLLFLILGAFCVLWVINATRNGKRHLNRYLEEEFGD